MKKMLALFGLLVWSFSANAQNAAVNLSVEFMKEPLGIDTARPRLSWELPSPERGAWQSAYQIFLSANASGLDPGKALWDSGKVNSSASSGVVYAGPMLMSRTRYFWKVRAWDGNGRQMKDSDAASFQTGFMDQKDLRAKWLWEDDQVKPMDYAYFRTEFSLDDDPAEAYALISAHNHYMLYINGRQVSGYVNPGVSNPFKNKLYLTCSITPFLRKGKNAIAAIGFYKGVAGQNYVAGTPGFLLEAWGKTKNGKEFSILSGPSWKVLADTPYDESAPWLSGRKNGAAEFFDGRKEPAGWKDAGFDDSAWRPAAVVSPGYILRSQYMPESKIDEVITPSKVTHPWFGVWLFKLPKEIGGWARVTASQPEAGRVTMRYSDRLFMRRAYHGAADEPTNTYFDKFYFAGKGEESYEPRFGYRGFRYIEVTGFKGRPSTDNIKGIYARTLAPVTAIFESSNALLNKIYEISVHTQAMSMVGQLVDCVNREQSQWHADAEIESGIVLYNFYDPHIVRKTLLDLKDGQWDDGRLPDFYPASPREFNYIPEWDFHYAPMLWRTYFYYNDIYLLIDCFPVLEKQIAYYETLRDQTGLIAKGQKIWHISDWPEDFARIDQTGPYLTVENLLYYETLMKSAQIAKILGKTDEEQKYRGIAAELKDAINKNLYDSQAKAYLDSAGSKERHQAAGALALQVGVVPEQDRDAVMAYVKSKGFASSVVLAYNLFDMLYDNDESEFAYSLVNSENFPGWGYMIKKGATTTWEGWTGLFGETYEHPFAAYPARFLISGLAGIKPAAPGWTTIEIRPHPAGDLKWAKASMRILPGEVAASWQKNNGEFKISVSIPGNTQARVSIPLVPGGAAKIYEGGAQVWPVDEKKDPHVKFLASDNAYANFMVRAGNYEFAAK